MLSLYNENPAYLIPHYPYTSIPPPIKSLSTLNMRLLHLLLCHMIPDGRPIPGNDLALVLGHIMSHGRILRTVFPDMP